MDTMTDHLGGETLARLVDDEPTEAEARHLEACERCRQELDAFREQTEALHGLPDLRPPKGDWAVLQARLVSEGLMEGGGRLRSMARTPGWMRTAAAVLIFLAGAGLGAGLTGDLGEATALGSDGPFRLASDAPPSLDEAAAEVRMAEREYMDALVRYRQLAEAEDDGLLPDPSSRIAALEYLVRAGQAALREAPADPFLNGMVASAMAERDAVLRRVSTDDEADWY